MHLFAIAVLSAVLGLSVASGKKCETFCEDEAECGEEFNQLWDKVKSHSKKEWDAVDSFDTGKGQKGKKNKRAKKDKKPKKTEDERKNIFKKGLKEMNKLNKRQKTSWCGKPSHVITLDKEERKKVLLGVSSNQSFVDTSSKKERPARQKREAAAMVKRGVTYDQSYWTGPVEQQMCGNCWAYAASHAVVGIFRRFLYKDNFDGSEIQLTRCVYHADQYDGCAGGQSYEAFDHLLQNTFLEESAYPADLESSPLCQTELLTHVPLVTGWKWAAHMGWGSMDSNNYLSERVASMKNELYWQPLIVYMNVGYYFDYYGYGAYDLSDADAAACVSINHAMIVVGYGSDEDGDYWIIKNSWGTYWGDQGYINVRAGKNLCNVEALVHFPIEY